MSIFAGDSQLIPQRGRRLAVSLTVHYSGLACRVRAYAEVGGEKSPEILGMDGATTGARTDLTYLLASSSSTLL